MGAPSLCLDGFDEFPDTRRGVVLVLVAPWGGAPLLRATYSVIDAIGEISEPEVSLVVVRHVLPELGCDSGGAIEACVAVLEVDQEPVLEAGV